MPEGRQELEQQIERLLDDTPVEFLERLAAYGDDAALRTLTATYARLGSIAQRLEVIRLLGPFDERGAAGATAMEFVANVAGNAHEPELVEAALQVLESAATFGKHYLAILVNSPAQSQVRENALRRFIARGTDEDLDFYRQLFERHQNLSGAAPGSSNARSKPPSGKQEERPAAVVPKLREIAFEALAPHLEDRELTREFDECHDSAIRKIALAELQTRGSPLAGDLALDTFERVNVPAADRAEAASVLLQCKGEKVAGMLLDTALEPATPLVLRERIADLLADLRQPMLDKKLSALLGRSKLYERLFAIRATRNLSDERTLTSLRRALNDREAEIRHRAAEELGRRRDTESIGALEKLLAKSKSPQDDAVALEGLTQLHGASETWLTQLHSRASSTDLEVRNTALRLLVGLAAPSSFDTFAAGLSSEDWASRRFAVLGLSALRDARAVPLLVECLERERGRLRVEIGDALFSLTGEAFADQTRVWKRWWTDHQSRFAVLSAQDLAARTEQRERARLRQTTQAPAEFFGVRIVSERVAFVIDVSGSMVEPLQSEIVDGHTATRLEVVKRELLQCLEALSPQSLFNLIPFNSAVSPWLEAGLRSSTAKSREEAVAFVERLGNRGGTNIFDALQVALSDPEVDTIFLLSDGEPTAGAITDVHAIRETIAEQNRSRGVVIHAVSVGSTLELLEWLAQDSGGRFVKYE